MCSSRMCCALLATHVACVPSESCQKSFSGHCEGHGSVGCFVIRTVKYLVIQALGAVCTRSMMPDSSVLLAYRSKQPRKVRPLSKKSVQTASSGQQLSSITSCAHAAFAFVQDGRSTHVTARDLPCSEAWLRKPRV